jgi:hypothetical protein
MPRETKAQKTSRLSMLLAAYDAKSRELRKLTKDVDEMKEQLRAETPGTYGDFTLAEGTPREILDQPEARKMLSDRKLPIPTKMTDAPIIVRPKV